MNDLEYLLEKTIIEYWGNPKTQIYFSNYFGDNFEMRAIIFSIVLFQVNYKFEEFKDEQLEKLKDYLSKSYENENTHDDNINILVLLAKHKNLL
jgi:hypothetical protein